MSPWIVHRKKIISALLGLMAIGYIASSWAPHKNIPHAVSVQATTASKRPIPLSFHTMGTVEAQQSVAITSQVTGILKAIHFQRGDTVQPGQLLFEIDPASFETHVQKAEAIFNKDQATWTTLASQTKRYETLVKQKYIPPQQYEDSKAATLAAQAQVAADKADVQQAKIDLEHTRIVSPLSGKTGDVSLRPGDLVTMNNPIPLVVINQLDPVWVQFHIPQQEIPKLLQYQEKKPLAVNVFTEDGSQYLGQGTLVFIDNAIGKDTGTLSVKASLPNFAHQVWPGLMVTIQLIYTVENSITIPIEAVQTDADGNFVYGIQNGKSLIKRVTVAQQEKKWAVISKGLSPEEKVITVFPPNFSEGTPITLDSPEKHPAENFP